VEREGQAPPHDLGLLGVTEKALGERWAKDLRAAGGFVQKIPASTICGIPDYIVVARPAGIRVVEAKLRLPGRVAYDPKQLRRAQRWFLEAFHAVLGFGASVLVLDPEGWVELDWGLADIPLPAESFENLCTPYERRS